MKTINVSVKNHGNGIFVGTTMDLKGAIEVKSENGLPLLKEAVRSVISRNWEVMHGKGLEPEEYEIKYIYED